MNCKLERLVRILDLFCGAGGAGEGYRRIGFDVTGVDIKPQPRNPHRFVEADALEYLQEHGHKYDAIHASPPCQRYSSLTALTSTKDHPDLIGPVRDMLITLGKPWVIENVKGAPLRNATMLCGTMFGLAVARHRYFETNFSLPRTSACNHKDKQLYTVLTKSCRRIGDMRGPSSHAIGKKAMGIDWMTQSELGEAIPPAYTAWIGQTLWNVCNANDNISGRL